MAFDDNFPIVGILLHWRVALATLSAAAITAAVGSAVPWFSIAQGIAFTCIGCGCGIVWHSAAWNSQGRPSCPIGEPTSGSTFTIAALLFGLFWGGASSSGLPSAIAGMVLLPLLGWVWLGFARTQPQLLGTRYPVLCLFVALLAYAAAAIFGMHVAQL